MAFFKQIFKRGVQIILPLLLGGLILWWVYKDFEFSKVGYVLSDVMDWKWMVLSLVFGILGHVIRGVRWKLTLEPIGEHPKTSHCIYAVFFRTQPTLSFLVLAKCHVAESCINMTEPLSASRWEQSFPNDLSIRFVSC